MTKKNKNTTFSYRGYSDDKDYLQELADDNDMDLSDIMNAITRHYIESGEVITIVKEIKRKKKK